MLRTDSALLARFRKGEREALELVYWAYVDRVERVVRHGFQVMRQGAPGGRVEGVRSDEIADVVQETFTRAFTERARLAYDGLRDYGPFLLTITRNLLVDRARKRGRELVAEDLDETVAENEQEEAYADEPTMQAVRDYLASLPADLCGVHEQRYVRGVSQEEAARALDLSRQKIRTLEKRLREGLASYLKRLGIQADDEAPTKLAAAPYGKGAQ